MTAHRFDPAKMLKLNDPDRLNDLIPDLIWEAFGAPRSAAVVEIGAGTGLFVAEFARRMDRGTIHAVDSEPVMLDWMRGHLDDSGEVRIVVTDADAGDLPLPDGTVDLVYTINLHHELEDPATMLAEARRVLRPGGLVGIVDWKRAETPKGPPLAHRIGTTELLRQLSEAAFVTAETHDILPYHDVVTALAPG